MTPEYFRDTVLGPRSTHPHFQKQRRKFALVSALVVLGVLLFALIVIWTHDSSANIFANVPAKFTWVAGICVFFMGFAATTAILSRLSSWNVSTRLKRAGDIKERRLDPWVIGLAIVLGAMGPYFITTYGSGVISPGIQKALLCFAFFPIFGLLFVIRIAEDCSEKTDDGKRRRPRFRVMLGMAIFFGAAFLVLSLIYDLSGSAKTMANWLPGYATDQNHFLGLMVGGVVVFVGLWLWRNPSVLGFDEVADSEAGASPEDPNATEAKSPKKKGFFAWLKGLFSKPEPPPPPPPPKNEPPDWLQEALDELDDAEPDVTLIQIKPNEVSPPSDRTDLRFLFGTDSAPSEDQVKVIDHFISLYAKSLEGGDHYSGPESETCPDLLVTGMIGSGRTTTLLACATLAAFVRGQRVLFIVPDDLRMTIAIKRIEGFLEGLHLHYYVSVGNLNDRNMDAWVNGISPLPHVLIGTPESVERHFYGHNTSDIERLRRTVRLPEVIIVDDLLDFDESMRCHLPFLVDKHRLLLAADYRPLQVVVSTQTVSRIGEQILGKRLFGVQNLNPENVIALRPRREAKAWRVHVETDDVGDTVERLVAQCVTRKLDVVLYRADIDEEERREQEARLTGDSSQGRVKVISQLDSSISGIASEEVDAIFYQEASSTEVCLALRLKAGHDGTVIFNVVERGTFTGKPPRPVPVLAERSATALMTGHLESVTRFLRPLSPVPEKVWSRFGVSIENAPKMRRNLEVTDQAFVLDQPPHVMPTQDIWAYVVSEKDTEQRAPVRMRGTSQIDHALYLTPQRNKVRIGYSKVDEYANRIGVWYDHASPIGGDCQIDLAHATQYRLILGQRSIGLRTIEQAAGQEVRLVSDVWHGSGIDRFLPVLGLSWTLADKQIARDFRGSVSDGIRWFSLKSQTRTVVDSKIVGHMSKHGKTTDISSVEFSFPAQFSAMVFAPREIEGDNLSDELGACLTGRWTTSLGANSSSAEDKQKTEQRNCLGSDYWPELTAALNCALRIKAPGLSYYARVLAFRMNDLKAPGKAIAWFVQPLSGGKTASSIVSDLLGRPDERKEFFNLAATVADRISSASNPMAYMRQMAWIGFVGDSRTQSGGEAARLLRASTGT